MESVAARDITVVVDYAHTPDGLACALQALRPFVKGRLVCVWLWWGSGSGQAAPHGSGGRRTGR